MSEEESAILKRFQAEIDKKLQEKFSSLRTAFRIFDTTKDGMISESEFIEGLVLLNANMTEAQIRQVFRALDKGGKRYLTFEEFCDMVQKKPLNNSPSTSFGKRFFFNQPDPMDREELESRNSRFSLRSKSQMKPHKHDFQIMTLRNNIAIAKNRHINEFQDDVTKTRLNGSKAKRKLQILPTSS